MKLIEALGIKTGQVVAFVGAGGKTTAIWRLLHEVDGPAVFTTTTKIMEPVLPPGGGLMLSPRPHPARLCDLLARAPRLVLAAGRLPEEYQPAAGHSVPSLPCKLDGLPANVLDDLVAECGLRCAPGPTWLVEADGAKGCGLKVPGQHEPVIPTSANSVIVCAHLNVIGQPASDKTVHRLAQAEAMGLRQGEPITPEDFVRVLASPHAGLKDIPPSASAVALLTQRDSVAHPAANALIEQLLATGRFSRVVVAALRAQEPVLALKARPARVTAVVLAAGASTRMGQLKQLLDWRGQPMVRHVVNLVRAAQLPAIVVLGCQADRVRAALAGSDARIVINEDWERGLSASLCAGLAAAPADAEAVLFVQADQPNITPQLLQSLVARFESGAPIVAPAHHGRRGTPVLFARELFDELLHISGDEGGRSLIQKYASRVATIQVDDPNILADIDTLEDYASLAPHPSSLLANIQGLVSDMDGVLWLGNRPMPGLIEFFGFLRQAKIRFVLATNNASKTSLEYVQRLADLGVQVEQREILCAAEATAEYLASHSPGASVFVIGEPPLANALAERGLFIAPEDAAQADFVVVGWNRNLTWQKLARATQLIRGGARFIGTNPDRTWPSEQGLLPGNGANLAFLQAATDIEPFLIGKPGRAMFGQALARLGLSASKVAMLGDRLETDIEGGQRAGLKTIFVCSGVQTREEALGYPVPPDLVLQDIAELTQVWKNKISN